MKRLETTARPWPMMYTAKTNAVSETTLLTRGSEYPLNIGGKTVLLLFRKYLYIRGRAQIPAPK
jgi:hypothetical protein